MNTTPDQKTSQFPKVSVYIVNHNYGRYFEQAIESLLAQSYDDFEILVVDNGSTDGSREIISRYATHPKVAVLFQENIGLNRTNNVAISRTTGRYIMRLDADDFLHENALANMVAMLDRRPDVGLVFPDYFLVDEQGENMRMIQRHNFDEVTILDQPAHGACTMIRRECLEALDGYDESYHCQDGWDIWVRFIQRFGVANIRLPLFYYRQHGASLTRNEERILSTRSEILRKAADQKSQQLDTIAVIPVRGSITDPNSLALRSLAGKPLLDWTIEAALEADRISRVLITSPDDEVEQHINDRFGDRVAFFKRDWKLALLDISLDQTLTELFSSLPEKWRVFEAIALLFVESPFRKARYIDTAIDALEVFNCNRVISVRRRPGIHYAHQGAGLVSLKTAGLISQESHEIFHPAGDIMAIRRGHLYRNTDDDMNVGHIEVDEPSGHRIISEWSWQMAEFYAESLKEISMSTDQNTPSLEVSS